MVVWGDGDEVTTCEEMKYRVLLILYLIGILQRVANKFLPWIACGFEGEIEIRPYLQVFFRLKSADSHFLHPKLEVWVITARLRCIIYSFKQIFAWSTSIFIGTRNLDLASVVSTPNKCSVDLGNLILFVSLLHL